MNPVKELIATRQMKKVIQFFLFSYIFQNDILMTKNNKTEFYKTQIINNDVAK